jgi:hypothetical protein
VSRRNQNNIKKFIKNQLSDMGKMPTIETLSKNEIESIVYYLNYIAQVAKIRIAARTSFSIVKK